MSGSEPGTIIQERVEGLETFKQRRSNAPKILITLSDHPIESTGFPMPSIYLLRDIIQLRLNRSNRVENMCRNVSEPMLQTHNCTASPQ